MNVRLALKLGLAMTALAALALVACGGAKPAKSAAASAGPSIDGCPVFPADNPWNTDISKLPVHPESQVWLESVGLDKPLHPDFGTVYNGAPNGIPYVTVHGNQPKVPITFEYADQSDPGPYPIPDRAPIEGGANPDGDRHVLVIDVDNGKLYEVFRAFKVENGWKGGSGAIFDLRSNKLRPEGWTSADAAGLPIFPGLVRYDEAVKKGAINHAVRFTVRRTQRGYIHPATHFASRRSDPDLPPMGVRVRLKAEYDISGFPKEAQVILTGLKRYGMILADNGGDWFVTGAPDSRWNDENLQTLKRVKVSDFEVVDTGPVHTG
jgi:hypothetical protein